MKISHPKVMCLVISIFFSPFISASQEQLSSAEIPTHQMIDAMEIWNTIGMQNEILQDMSADILELDSKLIDLQIFSKEFLEKLNEILVQVLRALPPPIPAIAQNLERYSINTLYKDQAWINYQDQMYIVQKGDSLPDGVLVLEIDPDKRMVLTDHGLIQ